LEKKYGEPVLEEDEWPKNKDENDSEVDYDDLDDEETVDSFTSGSEEQDL
jgi:hypothetical protein